MITRELVKAEIDKLDAANVELLYKIIKAIHTPMEMWADTPVSNIADEKNEKSTTWPEPVRQRQEILLQQAQQLRLHLGDPVAGLIEQFRDLPPEDDVFWQQILEN